VFPDGAIKITEKVRDNSHALKLLNETLFDEVNIKDLAQICHGVVSKGYYLVTLKAQYAE
jgi:hypothetical protein